MKMVHRKNKNKYDPEKCELRFVDGRGGNNSLMNVRVDCVRCNEGYSLAEAVKKSAADGKFSWTDGLNFVEPLKKIAPAIDDIDDVIPEVMDLDASEWNELVDYIQGRFDLVTTSTDGEENDIETKIEEALNAGVELLRLTQIIKA